MTDKTEILKKYLPDYTGDSRLITGSGSNRIYIRLTLPPYGSVIAVYGESVKENQTFCYMADGLKQMGLPAPKVFHELTSADGRFYIQEDLGNNSLFDALARGRADEGNYNEHEQKLIASAIDLLCDIHSRVHYTENGEGKPYDVLNPQAFYPYSHFNEDVIDYDFNYFRFCFLKAVMPQIDEARLTQNLKTFKEELLGSSMRLSGVNTPTVFLYRDFQPRNIMMDCGGKLYLIDFQGAQAGPPYYDLASFLWQASARYPHTLREEMIERYYERMKESVLKGVSPQMFKEQLRFFVLFRLLQVLGAYGYRGYFERKEHFLNSIPPAIENLRDWLKQATSYESRRLDYLLSLLKRVCALPQFKQQTKRGRGLTIQVNSFSYKKGVPHDPSGNGGGYVFDCRGIHNPGRYDRYKTLTGKDREVIQFLEEDGEILTFMESVCKLADAHVKRYIKRGFTSLAFSFGCTGGQHRSVYAAEFLADYIHRTYNLKVVLTHREQQIRQVIMPLRKDEFLKKRLKTDQLTQAE